MIFKKVLQPNRWNPLCFSVVYIYGGVLSGAGNSAAVSDLQLSSSKSGVGKSLLP